MAGELTLRPYSPTCANVLPLLPSVLLRMSPNVPLQGSAGMVDWTGCSLHPQYLLLARTEMGGQ